MIRRRQTYTTNKHKLRSAKQLMRNDNTPVQKSLFDYVPEENFNGKTKQEYSFALNFK